MGLSAKISLTVTRNVEEIVLYGALSFSAIGSVDLGGLWERIQSFARCPSLGHVDIGVSTGVRHLL